MIIEYALEDASPEYLTDSPIREYDEDNGKYHDMKDNPWKYICTENDCRMSLVKDSKLRMACDIIHEQHNDLIYHYDALRYVSVVESLAFVSTSCLQTCCDLFCKKFYQIQAAQFGLRNWFTLPESCNSSGYRDMYWRAPGEDRGCTHIDPETRVYMHKTMQRCKAIEAAYRTEGDILKGCKAELLSVLRKVGQAAADITAQTLEARLEAADRRAETLGDLLEVADRRAEFADARLRLARRRAQTLELGNARLKAQSD